MNEQKDFGEPEKTFGVVKRCPKCLQLALSYHTEIKKLKCSKCGFEQRWR